MLTLKPSHFLFQLVISSSFWPLFIYTDLFFKILYFLMCACTQTTASQFSPGHQTDHSSWQFLPFPAEHLTRALLISRSQAHPPALLLRLTQQNICKTEETPNELIFETRKKEANKRYKNRPKNRKLRGFLLATSISSVQ